MAVARIIQIDTNGTVLVSEEARHWFTQRPGSYQIVPTRSELLVAFGGAGADASPAGEIVLLGDLSRIGFPDLTNLLVHARMSGVLRLRSNSAQRTLVFASGELRGVSSNRVGERLGEVAVRMGFVKREQMEELLEKLEPGQRPGRMAVDQGLLSDRDLWSVMQEQVTTIFMSIVRENEGSFALFDENVEDLATVPGLPVEMLLMESMRRMDEETRVERGPSGERFELILQRFDEYFRDIFATAAEAGAEAALRSAAAFTFAGESAQLACFHNLELDPSGGLPVELLVGKLGESVAGSVAEREQLLIGVLSKGALFLLFVAGEHLDLRVHEALHARVKATVAALAG